MLCTWRLACSLWLLLARTNAALWAHLPTDRPIARAFVAICMWPSNACDEIGTINRLSPTADLLPLLHLEYRVFSRSIQRKHHGVRRLPPTRPCCFASRTTSRRARTSTLTTTQLSTHCNYTVTVTVAVRVGHTSPVLFDIPVTRLVATRMRVFFFKQWDLRGSSSAV